MNPSSGLFDAHIHVWTDDFDTYPLAQGFGPVDLWRPSFTPEDYFAYAAQVGKVRINLVQMTWYGLDHSYIIDLIASAPDRYVGTGVIPAFSDVSLPSPGRTMKALANHGIYAFRIRGRSAQKPCGQGSDWLNQAGYESMFATGGEENLALSFLAGPDDLPDIDRMCERYPETPVIIDHLGGVRVRKDVRADQSLELLCRLARHRRVMVKIGPLQVLGHGEAPYKEVLPIIEQVVDAFGPERCMWESDSGGPIEMKNPALDFPASIDLIKSANFLSETDRAWILGGTAENFFFNR
jgi:predicted TIM-barrel fold metal-dependent hydrolase